MRTNIVFKLKLLTNRFLGRIEKMMSRNRIRPLHTIYFNFRTMPIKRAFHLPVYIYGKAKFVDLEGSVELINTHPKHGMIKIGRHIDNYESGTTTIIAIGKQSTIIFEGIASFGRSLVLRITDGGHLRIGNKVWIGESVKIDCAKSIIIREGASITHGCFLTDSNHHYVINENNIIYRHKGEIIIGRYNWIGNNTIVIKGTITSDYSVISQGSMLNKNYIELYKTNESMLLAGVPARIHRKGCRRIFGAANEKAVTTYFKSHPEESVMVWEGTMEDSMDDRFFM